MQCGSTAGGRRQGLLYTAAADESKPKTQNFKTLFRVEKQKAAVCVHFPSHSTPAPSRCFPFTAFANCKIFEYMPVRSDHFAA
jgi:hypothetical protein